MKSSLVLILCALLLSGRTYAQVDESAMQDLDAEIEQASPEPSTTQPAVESATTPTESSAAESASSQPAEQVAEPERAPTQEAASDEITDEDIDGENFDLDEDDQKIADEDELDSDEITEEPKEELQAEEGTTPEELEKDLEAPVEVVETPAPVEATPIAATSDEPDLQYENRLHEIYTKYNQSTISSVEWDRLTAGRQPEIYSIEKGDSLWDLSLTFFGDGFYWPKLWSVNSGITNPHRISVGQQMRFVSGNEQAPPVLIISQTQVDAEKNEKVVKEDIRFINIMGERIEIPPPERIPKPVLTKFPPSLPIWQSVNMGGNYDSSGVEIVKPKLSFGQSTDLANMFVEKAPEAIGVITENESGYGQSTASQFENVIVKMQAPTAVGSEFTVVQDEGGVKGRNSWGSDGNALEIQGRIKILEQVNDSEPVYRAQVTKSLSQIKNGASVVSMEIPKFEFSKAGTQSSVTAQIVGGQFDQNRLQLGTGNVVYLNVGEQGGLKKNDILNVIKNQSRRNENTEVNKYTRSIGVLKVVDVQPKVATAVVIEAYESILVGDATGANFSVQTATKDKDIDELQSDDLDSSSDGDTELDQDLDEALEE